MDPDLTVPSAPQPGTTFTPPSDPGKYIRTYAKDVAMLTNTPLPERPQVSASTIATAPNNQSTTDGVTVTEFDASQVNRGDNPSSPKEFQAEVVALSDTDSDGIFAGGPGTNRLGGLAAQTSSMMPQGSIGIAPTVAPSGEQEDREAVLARLRAKVAQRQQDEPLVHETPYTPPVPVFVPPTPALVAAEPAPEPVLISAPIIEDVPMRAAAPDFSTLPEPVLPIPPQEISFTANIPVATPPGPSPLHTYSGDFASHIDEQKSSTFSVLAAQSDAGQTPRSTVPARKRNFVPLFAGAAMLVVGIGAVTGAYFFTQNGASVPVAASVPSLIQYDEAVEVSGTGKDLMQAVADVAQGGSVSGNVVVTYVTSGTATSSTGIAQPGGVLIRNIKLSAPDILLRNIDQASTVGVIKSGNESRPFMILKVNSYERTFAGMLAWERTMPSELSTFYPAYSALPIQTGTSTSAVSAGQLASAQANTFTDAIVSNYDVRILHDGSGRTILLYGYRGKDQLIIARDEAAFTALITRLSASGN